MRSWLSNWKKRRDANVEAELRAAKPQPSAGYVKALAARINPRAVRPVRTRTRIGVALTATACMMAVVGATGGFSFAASSVRGVTHSVANLGAPQAVSAKSPASSGHNAGVRNAACTQYGSAPTVNHFTPPSGAAGNTTVTVSGTNYSGLSEVSSVSVGGASASPNIISSTQLTFLVPSDAASGSSKITVTNCNGSADSTDNFKVLAAPSITNVSPSEGGYGTPVTVTGTGLDGVTSVTIGGVSATIKSSSTDTEIDTSVPAKAAVGDGSLVVSGPAGSDSVDFHVDSGAPTVSSFTPASGPADTVVRVNGKGFFEGQSSAPDVTDLSVQFGDGGSATPTSIDSDTQLHVAVPAGAASGPITVTTQLGAGSSKNSFTFFGTPNITSISPSFGAVGNANITITGTSFTGATEVDFGSTSDPTAAATLAAHAITVTNTKITVKKIPAGAVTGQLTIVTPRGNGTSSDTFTVITAAPTIGTVTPGHGGYNTPVEIDGSGFTGATVTFNNKAAPILDGSDANTILTYVPVGAPLSAGYRGKNPGLVVTNKVGPASHDFTVDDTAPKITSVTSDAAGRKKVTSGKPTDVIYLNGTNLDGVTSVDIGDGSVAKIDFTAQSATQIQLTIPTGEDTTTAPITANDSSTDTSGSSADFTVYQAPVVIGVPAFAAAGKSISVTGTNFLGVKTLGFTPDGGGTTLTAPARLNKDGSVSANVPSGTKGVTAGTSYSVSVILSDGLSGDSGSSEALIVSIPKNLTISQNGTSVEIDADSGLTGTTSVVIGSGKTATTISAFTIVSNTKLTFTLSGTEASGAVSVTNAAGTGKTKASVIGGPTVKSAKLTASTQSVKISGANLLGSAGSGPISVTVGGNAASFTAGRGQTQTSITVTGSGLTSGSTVHVVVTTDVGSVDVTVRI